MVFTPGKELSIFLEKIKVFQFSKSDDDLDSLGTTLDVGGTSREFYVSTCRVGIIARSSSDMD